MIRWLLLVVLVGCFGDTTHRHPLPDAEPSDPVEPAACDGHCVITHPQSGTACCDSVTCWIDPESNDWVVMYCDPPPPNPCDQCTADEICVQSFGGVCQETGAPTCVPKTVECPNNACTEACQAAYCGSPYQCEDREPCGPEAAGAFTCYGP